MAAADYFEKFDGNIVITIIIDDMLNGAAICDINIW